MGLDIGGDDYITKPFKLGVLISRINALLRRAGAFGAADTELCSNGIRVLLLQSQAFKNGEALELTAAEYKLLCLFMHNPNTVLTKGQILDKLWDCDGNYIDSSTLTVYIRRLRMKIEDDPGAPQMLLTVRGMGYKWSVISLRCGMKILANNRIYRDLFLALTLVLCALASADRGLHVARLPGAVSLWLPLLFLLAGGAVWLLCLGYFKRRDTVLQWSRRYRR